ncbi:hypothetical protein GCM10011366_30710 [Ornithinimicrobium tianjinense]|uniref:D-glucuronyl C5-epimerase C-terminal domain-containing protein n=1 Tax=Ornithinimicrobium tianjinense TaxID=1195761 RepID=A0A917BY54_9MICO|nr:hypothetical protein GCM10011366_30710 [Ornithinimicrobium tianjinense]
MGHRWTMRGTLVGLALALMVSSPATARLSEPDDAGATSSVTTGVEVVPVPERHTWTTTAETTTSTPRPVDVPRQPLGAFEESTREPQPVPQGLRAYESGTVRRVPFGLVDSTGVRVFRADWEGDKIFDHPVAQAQYALSALESYRLTGEQQYLDVALKNAQRIVDRRHEIDGAWYFPYDFDFDLYRNGRGVLTAPWSSGMSSGQALSVFVRLHEVTGDQAWRDAADHTFAAFLQEPDGRG